MTVSNALMRAACLSIATLGATAVVTTVMMPDSAYAKGNKSKGKSASAKAKVKKAKTSGNKTALALGVHPSELGALNAANANINALENASPNSRVGMIAIFADAARVGVALDGEIAIEQAIVDALTAPSRPTADIVADYDQAIIDGTMTDALQDEYDDALAYDAASKVLNDLIAERAIQTALERSLLEDAANKDVTDEIIEAVKTMLDIVAIDDPASGS